jgi:hypothetical protein
MTRAYCRPRTTRSKKAFMDRCAPRRDRAHHPGRHTSDFYRRVQITARVAPRKLRDRAAGDVACKL